MKNVPIGCGQITWHGLERSWTEEEILAEIAQAGYAGAPAGPQRDRTVQETIDLYQRFGLRPAPGYLSGPFWDPAVEPMLLERAHDFGAFSQEAGISEIYVAAAGFDDYITRRGLTRNQVAGRVMPEDGMTDAEYDQFAATLTKVGKITLEYGVRSCFHNHVGSTIETRAEIDRLFSMVERQALFLGPDTGHLAWAGENPVDFCRDYADHILTLHLKDIDEAVSARGLALQWDYRSFTKAGIWTELGQGAIDFPAIFSILDDSAFDGWLIVETDVTQLATPLESAVVSRAYLRSLGM